MSALAHRMCHFMSFLPNNNIMPCLFQQQQEKRRVSALPYIFHVLFHVIFVLFMSFFLQHKEQLHEAAEQKRVSALTHCIYHFTSFLPIKNIMSVQQQKEEEEKKRLQEQKRVSALTHCMCHFMSYLPNKNIICLFSRLQSREG